MESWLNSQTYAIWAQTLVLLATAIIIWRYTRETFLLRKEAVRQNDIALRPVVIPEFSMLTEKRMRLWNIGHGAAIDIIVDAQANHGSDKMVSLPIHYLQPSKEKDAAFEGSGESVTFFAISKLYEGLKANSWTVRVRFSDVEGRSYAVQAIGDGRGGYKLEGIRPSR